VSEFILLVSVVLMLAASMLMAAAARLAILRTRQAFATRMLEIARLEITVAALCREVERLKNEARTD
jgi:hypothetical protein